MIETLFKQSAVFNVASSVREQLSGASALFQRPPPFRIGVRGQLALNDYASYETVLADCTFIASLEWLRLPLKVFCHERWVKPDLDWHVLSDGALCYEFDGRWRAELARVAVANAIPEVAAYAGMWCINGTRKLLEKHLIADRLNIPKWSPEWDEWPHGNDAAGREYDREQEQAK